MHLIVNTSANDQFTIALSGGDGRLLCHRTIKAKFKQSEKLLPAIDSLLRQKLIKLDEIKGIIVVLGPGGFTSLRIGVITANTLAYGLNIPVVGLKLNEFKNIDELAKKGVLKLKKAKPGSIVVPFYGREPNITRPKDKLL